MENIKRDLEQLFDEMLEQVKFFKRKTYDGIFKSCYNKYGKTIDAMGTLCGEASEEERDALVEQLAFIIPEYASGKMQYLSKSRKERQAVDFNMNMAVYIVPLFTYTHNQYCERVAERMVLVWNEKEVTSLTLGQSGYDDIAGGFKRSLCYITTAVCEYQGRPDDCYELTMLRMYRDEYMAKDDSLKSLVEEYYESAPGLVQILNMQKDAGEIYDGLYRNYIEPCVLYIAAGEMEQCRDLYIQMVHGLQKKYLYS